MKKDFTKENAGHLFITTIAAIEAVKEANDKDIQEVNARVDTVDEKAEKAILIAEETQKMEGQKGEKGDRGEDGKDGHDGTNGKDGLNGKDGIDGKDGKDGLNGLDGKDGADGKDGKDGSPDSAEDIRNKLELLEGEERLDAKAIKNLPETTEKIIKMGGGGNIEVFDSNGKVGSGSAIKFIGAAVTHDGHQATVTVESGSSYTDEEAQDAVGTILTDTATIDFTYNDATPSITADVINDSITNSKLANMATATFKGRTTSGTGDPEDLSTAQAKTMLNLTGTNSGDVTLAAFGSSANANGASLSGQVLTLQPASSSHPGGVTTGSQTLAGAKTFSTAVITQTRLNIPAMEDAWLNLANSQDFTINLSGTGAIGLAFKHGETVYVVQM